MPACETCGDSFDTEVGLSIHETKRHGANSADREEVKCANCEKTKKIIPSQVNESGNNFCDRKCQKEYYNKNPPLSGSQHPNYKEKPIVECAWCGKEKEIPAYKDGKFENFFCDMKCHAKYKSENLKGSNHPRWVEKDRTVVCSNCGKDLERSLWNLQRSENFFCSTKCESEWKKEHLRGENHPHWTGGYKNWYGISWTIQREKVLERDNYQCVICGKTKEKLGKDPQVHHIKPFRKFGLENHEEANKLSNLIALCNRHHNLFEGYEKLEVSDFRNHSENCLQVLLQDSD